MERKVYLIADGEEYYLGRVSNILSTEARTKHRPDFLLALQGIVETLVFDDDSRDYMTCSIEVRE